MLKTLLTIFALLFTIQQVSAQTNSLPERKSPIPQTTKSVPHVQIGISANEKLTAELLLHVSEFPGVKLGPTRVSLPGATGFQLERSLKLARPEAIVGGREFAHIHPDGSLHASLHPETAQIAVKKGWAILHPWSNQRAGWEGFVMIYTPQNEQELEIVIRLIRGSYNYITGKTLP